jgi:hypothetical protein
MEAIDPRWRKSSYSDNGGECVEVGGDTRRVLVRDTQDRTGPVLRLSPAAWRRFADQAKRSLAPGADEEAPAGRAWGNDHGILGYALIESWYLRRSDPFAKVY